MMRVMKVLGVLTALLLVITSSGFMRAQQNTSDGKKSDTSDGKKSAAISDRERAGLRGPVKSCTEEWNFTTASGDQQKFSNTTVYDRSGRRLSITRGSGKDRWVENYSYTADGRPLKVTFGKADGPQEETTYSYDNAGRLLRIATDGQKGSATLSPLDAQFQYDEQGRKSSVRMAPPKQKNTAISIERDGSDGTFQATAMAQCDAVEACASVKTTYNENDRPSGAELRDGEGQVITRLVRSFDGKGNVIAERDENQNPELMIPPEMKSELKDQLNAAQKRTIGQFLAGFMASASSYSYDGEGRLTERRTVNPVMGQETKTVKYNEQGDTMEEHLVRTGSSAVGGGISEQGVFFPDPSPPSATISPEESDTRYSYEYDQYGNWTQQTTETRSGPNEPFRPGRTVSRKLTYYGSADDSQP